MLLLRFKGSWSSQGFNTGEKMKTLSIIAALLVVTNFAFAADTAAPAAPTAPADAAHAEVNKADAKAKEHDKMAKTETEKKDKKKHEKKTK